MSCISSAFAIIASLNAYLWHKSRRNLHTRRNHRASFGVVRFDRYPDGPLNKEGVAMKATFPRIGILLAAALTPALASAQTFCSPVFQVPLPAGPDARGPGFYSACPSGMVYGPNYWLRPPTEPFNGPMIFIGQQIMAQQMQQKPPTSFPNNPYIRSPRDFFMWRENMEDQVRRESRPALVP
jgi:hypothetical protein